MHEGRDVLWCKTWCATEHLISLDFPRERKARRLVHEPRHEREIEKRRGKSTVGRGHAVARVEITPLEAHGLATRTIRRWRRCGLDDDVRARTGYGRDCAAESNGLGTDVVAGLSVGINPLPVKKVEGDHLDSSDSPAEEVLAGLLHAPREELEWIVEGGRPGIGGVRSREGEAELVGDPFDLVRARQLAAETIEVERRDDQSHERRETAEREHQERHDTHSVAASWFPRPEAASRLVLKGASRRRLVPISAFAARSP